MAKDRTFSSAIHILSVLSYGAPKRIKSDELATGMRTNPGLVRRLLSRLSEHDLVVSYRGKGGGSQLARAGEKITLADIYEAVREGPLFGSFDKEPYRSCPVSCSMGKILTHTYRGLEKDLLARMKKIRLSDITGKIA